MAETPASARVPPLSQMRGAAPALRVGPQAKVSGVFVELIADSANRQDIMGVLRVCLQLLSQPVYVRIDVALITFVLRAPDTVK